MINKYIPLAMRKKLRIYDCNALTNKDQKPIVLDGQATITHLSLCNDPNLILSVGLEKGIRVWDKRTKKTEKTLNTGEVTNISRSNDGTTIAACCGREIHLFNSDTLVLTNTIKLPKDVTCAAVHPASRRFVAAYSNDEVVRVFDIEGTELASHKGHHGSVRCVAFDPLGLRFASGAEDSTIRIWELPSTATPSPSPPPASAPTTSTPSVTSSIPSSKQTDAAKP
jgi:serine-threonine kinase receptor-associated protein